MHLHKPTSQATPIAGKIFPGLAPNVTPKCGLWRIRPTPGLIRSTPWTAQNHATLLRLWMDGPRSSQDLPQLEGTSSHALPRCFSQSSGHFRGKKKKKACTWLHISPTVRMKDAAKFSPRSCRDFRRQPFFRAARPQVLVGALNLVLGCQHRLPTDWIIRMFSPGP